MTFLKVFQHLQINQPTSSNIEKIILVVWRECEKSHVSTDKKTYQLQGNIQDYI